MGLNECLWEKNYELKGGTNSCVAVAQLEIVYISYNVNRVTFKYSSNQHDTVYVIGNSRKQKGEYGVTSVDMYQYITPRTETSSVAV